MEPVAARVIVEEPVKRLEEPALDRIVGGIPAADVLEPPAGHRLEREILPIVVHPPAEPGHSGGVEVMGAERIHRGVETIELVVAELVQVVDAAELEMHRPLRGVALRRGGKAA